MPSNYAVRCPNNHFYDSSKFSSCPYCNEIGSDMPTFAMPMSPQGPDGGATLPLDAPRVPSPVPPTIPVSAPPPFPTISSASANGSSYSDDDNKTISLSSFDNGLNRRVDPTAGWLICIKGPAKGKTFAIRANRNFIGRAPDMDISIAEDKHISRYRHAVITYVPKNRMFIAQPGESRELFYINDTVVLDNVVLKVYDKIEIGQSKFMFLPLCGEKFSWEDFKR